MNLEPPPSTNNLFNWIWIKWLNNLYQYVKSISTGAGGTIAVGDLANGTDGELITWDSSGSPTTVPVGTGTHVLTSNGAGAEPTFRESGNITAEYYGAVGDGSTDDTAIFTTIESTVNGSHVNLLGNTHKVDAVPNGNDYYNGAFLVGTDLYVKNAAERNHPFAGPATTVRYVDPVPKIYRGLNVAQFPIGNGENVYLWREAPGHGTLDLDTEIKCDVTDDHGYSFKSKTGPGNSGVEHTLVYRNASADTRNFASGVMSSRLGVVAARVEVAATHLDPVFLYSDDNGVTWSSTVLTGYTGPTWNFHSKIYPWPASAGGHDTTGFICYFYTTTGIGSLKTTNNGSTWTETLDIVVKGAFAAINEMSVARVGSEDKWVMGARTGANLAIATSTNMTTWTAVSDSGLLLGNNPPELLYEDGKIWVLGFSRRDKAILTEYENAVLIAGANASGLYAGTSSLTGWEVITSLSVWPTGYASVQEIRGRWYALFNGENFAGSTQSDESNLMMLSPDALVPQKRLEDRGNLFVNGSMMHWPMGTTLTGTTRDVIIPGFTFARTSAVTGWTITRITGDKAPYAMRIQRDDTDTSTANMNAVINLPFDVSKTLADKQVTVAFRARAGSGYSAASDFLGLQLRQTNHTSEQAVTSNTGLYGTGDAAVGTSSSGITLTTDWQKFVMNPSRLDDDTTQLMLKIFWVPVGTATNDYIDIEMIQFVQGNTAPPFIFEDYHLEKSRCDRFVQVFDTVVRATTIDRNLYPGGQMHIIPTISLSSGAVSGTTTVDGVGIDNTTGSPITPTVTARCIF